MSASEIRGLIHRGLTGSSERTLLVAQGTMPRRDQHPNRSTDCNSNVVTESDELEDKSLRVALFEPTQEQQQASILLLNILTIHNSIHHEVLYPTFVIRTPVYSCLSHSASTQETGCCVLSDRRDVSSRIHPCCNTVSQLEQQGRRFTERRGC